MACSHRSAVKKLGRTTGDEIDELGAQHNLLFTRVVVGVRIAAAVDLDLQRLWQLESGIEKCNFFLDQPCHALVERIVGRNLGGKFQRLGWRSVVFQIYQEFFPGLLDLLAFLFASLRPFLRKLEFFSEGFSIVNITPIILTNDRIKPRRIKAVVAPEGQGFVIFL